MIPLLWSVSAQMKKLAGQGNRVALAVHAKRTRPASILDSSSCGRLQWPEGQMQSNPCIHEAFTQPGDCPYDCSRSVRHEHQQTTWLDSRWRGCRFLRSRNAHSDARGIRTNHDSAHHRYCNVTNIAKGCTLRVHSRHEDCWVLAGSDADRDGGRGVTGGGAKCGVSIASLRNGRKTHLALRGARHRRKHQTSAEKEAVANHAPVRDDIARMTRREIHRLIEAHDTVWKGWWPTLVGLPKSIAHQRLQGSYPTVFATIAHMVETEI